MVGPRLGWGAPAYYSSQGWFEDWKLIWALEGYIDPALGGTHMVLGRNPVVSLHSTRGLLSRPPYMRLSGPS
jgi:hypothetical protein